MTAEEIGKFPAIPSEPYVPGSENDTYDEDTSPVNEVRTEELRCQCSATCHRIITQVMWNRGVRYAHGHKPGARLNPTGHKPGARLNPTGQVQSPRSESIVPYRPRVTGDSYIDALTQAKNEVGEINVQIHQLRQRQERLLSTISALEALQ